MTTAGGFTGWVVGAGGLLGARLEEAIAARAGSRCHRARRFSWRDAAALAIEIDEEVASFAGALAPTEQWLIAWSAGSGVIGTSVEELAAETDALVRLLAAIEKHLGDRPGAFFLASSAGGLHAASVERPLTEHTALSPLSDYGRNKQRQETIVRDFTARAQVPTLIGRIANLYGPGQNLGKAQGFISQLSRCLIYNLPVHVYVPLDTMRDFYFVQDCARHIAECLVHLLRTRPLDPIVKIFASEQATSLARVIGIFSRLARHQPKVICAPRKVAGLQPPALQFRSEIWRELDPPQRTDLAVGIHRVHEHQLRLHRAGRLQSPQERRLF